MTGNVRFKWLALCGWPLLAAVIIISIPVMTVRWSMQIRQTAGPRRGVSEISYKQTRPQNKMDLLYSLAMHRLYAPDLFASPGKAGVSSTDNFSAREEQANTILAEAPLFLPTPAAIYENNILQNPYAIRTSADGGDFLSLNYPAREKRKMGRNYSKVFVEAAGELKQFSVWSNIVENISSVSGRKPWSFTAQVRFNKEGAVDYVIVETSSVDDDLRQELIKRLYQCRLDGLTQACEGTVTISCPGTRQ
jgi:hypothetical protein